MTRRADARTPRHRQDFRRRRHAVADRGNQRHVLRVGIDQPRRRAAGALVLALRERVVDQPRPGLAPHRLLTGRDYHHCCHSNLTRALAQRLARPLPEAEPLVHDVLNVFMCTGFARDTGKYLMKASPVRPGDHLEFFAEIALIAALSACPGGDCGSEHSSDAPRCHPLLVEVYQPAAPPRGCGTC